MKGLSTGDMLKIIKKEGWVIVINPTPKLLMKSRENGYRIRQRSTVWNLFRRVYEISI